MGGAVRWRGGVDFAFTVFMETKTIKKRKHLNRKTNQNSKQGSRADFAGFTLDGVKSIFSSISLPELALIGAAGFVIWRNRETIQNLLEKNGIEAPLLSADVGDIIQSGLDMINVGPQKEALQNRH